MPIYQVGPFHLRSPRRVLVHKRRVVAAGPKVVETLLALIEHRGVLAPKDVLIERLWPGAGTQESNLAQNVYALRRLFREYGAANPIETVPGAGYRLIVPVTVVAEKGDDRAARAKPARAAAAAIAAAGMLAIISFALIAGRNGQPAAPPALSQQGGRIYSIGRFYWNRRTSSDVRKSLRYFGEVIERDPESPLGYAGIADAYATMGDYCYGTHRPSVYFALAEAYARQAIALDTHSASAHATLGFVLLHRRRQPEALDELRRALADDPSYAPAHEWYGIELAREGRLPAAWAELTVASRLEPLSVSSIAWLEKLADREGRAEEASLYAAQVREMVADFGNRRPPRGHPTWAAIEETAAIAP